MVVLEFEVSRNPDDVPAAEGSIQSSEAMEADADDVSKTEDASEDAEGRDETEGVDDTAVMTSPEAAHFPK